MRQVKFTAGAADAKKRLDHFLVERIAGEFSRSFLQKMIVGGSVLVNGSPSDKHTRLRGGDEITLSVPPPLTTNTQAEAIPVKIVFEDESLVVVDKPAGMVVHPAPGNRSGTLVNALLAHCGDLSGIGGRLRPGIVHRLDKDTSGLLVVAKSDHAHRSLSEQFKGRSISRKYIAFVRGSVELDNGTVDIPVERDRRQRQKMAAGFGAAKEAVTHYRVLKRFRDYTMLKLTLETGRTHQIRVHMKYLRHPLLGDRKYGRGSLDLITRHALHAATLGFTHPVTGKFLEFESDLPPDMQRLRL